MRAHSLAVAALGASAVIVAACWGAPDDLLGVEWRCATTAECLAGMVCTDSRCADPARVLRFASAPVSFAAGACSSGAGLRIESEGTANELVVVAAALPVRLSGTNPATGHPIHFFTASDCNPSTEVTQVEIPAGGALSSIFYVQTIGAGTWALRGRALNYATDARQDATVAPGPPVSIAFTTAAQDLALKLCSEPATVEVHDVYGNAVPAAAARTVALTHNGDTTFGFFTDAACTVAGTAATIGAGKAVATFYFRGTGSPATVTIAATEGSRVVTQDETLSLRIASKLSFISPAQTLPRDNCSAPVTVQVQDAAGLPAPVLVLTTVNLSVTPASMASLFADSACTLPISARDILPLLGKATFYFRGNALGPLTLTASTSAFGAAQQDESVGPPVPVHLGFATGAQTVVAGTCSSPVIVESWGPLNTPAAVFADTEVALATRLSVYLDASCNGAPVQTAVIPTGASSATVWVSSTLSGPASVAVSAAGLTPATQNEVIAPAPAAAAVYASSPQTVTAGLCSGLATLQLQDAFGNVTTSGTPLTATLATTPGAAATFYPPAGCATGATTSLTFPGGSSTAQFRFLATVAQPISLDVTPASIQVSGTSQPATIQPAAPASLKFTSAPQTVVAGECSSPVTLEARDAFNNVAPAGAAVNVTLSTALTSVQFFASADCSGPAVTTVSIAAGQSSVTYSFKGNIIGTGNLNATSALAAPAGQPTTIAAATPVSLTFRSAPQTLLAGACSAPVILDARDTFGNIAPTPAAVAVPVAAAGLSNVSFFAGPGCSGSAVTSVTLAAAQSNVTYSFRGTTTGGGSLTVGSALTNPAPQAVTINAAARATLEFATAPQSVVAGACTGPVTLQSRDAYGNIANTGAVVINLAVTTLTSFTFFGAAGCGTSTSSVTLSAGATTASYWFRGNAIGSGTLTATPTATPPAAATPQAVTINPAPPTKLVWGIAPPASLTAGVCSGAIRLDAQDQYNNLAPTAAAVTITPTTTLPALPTPVTFYAGTSCGGSGVTTLTLGAGASSVLYSFRANTSGNGNVNATASLTSPGAQAVTITAAAPTTLRFATSTPPQTVTAGFCSGTVRLEQVDQFGNLATSAAPLSISAGVAGLGGVTLYTATACGGTSGGAVTLTLAAGQNNVTYSFRGITAGMGGLSVVSGLTNPGNQSLTVNAAAPFALRFSPTTPQQTVTAGVCSTPVRLESVDQYGNLSSVSGSTTINVGSTLANLNRYVGVGCTGGAVGTLTMATGQNTVTYSFLGTTAGTGGLSASWSLADPPNQPVTVNAAAAASLVYGTAPLSITAGTCSTGVQLDVKDAFGNAATVASPVTVTLSGSGGVSVTLHATAGCGGAPVGSVVVPTGAGSVTYFFKGTAAGTAQLSFTSSLGTDNQIGTINAGPAASLVFASAPPPPLIAGGGCQAASLVRLELRDAWGNPAVAAATFDVTPGDDGTFPGTLAFRANCGGSNVVTLTFFGGTTFRNYFFLSATAGSGGLTVTNIVGLANPSPLPFTFQ